MKKREVFTKVPSELLKEFLVVTLISLGFGLTMDATSFLLQFSKNAMVEGHVILSLVLISLYYIRRPLETFSNTFIRERNDIMQEHIEIVLTSRASTILLKTKSKVLHRNELQGFEEKMPSSKIIKTCKAFLESTWHKKVFFIHKGVDILSTIVMFVGLITVSKFEIEHTKLFIAIVVVSVFSEIFFTNMRMKTRNKHRDERRRARMIEEEAYQNIVQLEPINDEHASFLTDNYISASKQGFSINRNLQKKINTVRALNSMTLSIFTILVLVIKTWEVGLENANLEMLMSAISLVSIYSQFTHRIASLVDIVESYRDLNEEKKIYQNDFENIIGVYEKETENDEKENIAIKGISVPVFKVHYRTDNNSQPFELVSSSVIHVRPGDFVMLTGDTGSGKSTLIKMLTSNLHFDGFEVGFEADKDGYPKSVIHQDKVILGSNSILKEITLGKPEYDREKLFEILHALHLYEEISERSSDVLAYLDKTGIGHYSSGQVQRLALARTLLNVDDSTQIIAFDEATNNQNDEIGLRVLRYIKETYKNSVVLFATHQVAIATEVATKHLHFTHSTDEMNFQVDEV